MGISDHTQVHALEPYVNSKEEGRSSLPGYAIQEEQIQRWKPDFIGLQTRAMPPTWMALPYNMEHAQPYWRLP